MSDRISALLLAFLLSACGGGESPRETMLRQTMASTDVQRAREHAPDLVAQAERAHEQARAFERDGNLRAADDEETRARLLLAAALAETDRAISDEQRVIIENETSAQTQQAEHDEQERVEIEHENARMAASVAAREELARALDQATREEPRRRNLVSSSTAGSIAAASAFARQAELDLATAIAIGAPAESADAARAALTRFRAASASSSERIHAAAEARVAALEALGRARAILPAPSQETIASLVEMAGRFGVAGSMTPRGFVVENVGNAARARIVELATAFATGPLVIELRSPPNDRAAVRLADAFVDQLSAAGIARNRMTVITNSAEGQASSSIAVVFSAYRAVP